ncbi:uncharacterized protein [Hetaerina americana]|uniref:uncharacterized protein n=1 Tax=Hetaerina americana TaxID=62018 RepID=UPI003A7F2EB0
MSTDRAMLRVPPFWPEEPALWFAQLEGQFFLAGISEDAKKFYTVVSHLEPRFAQEVKDVISNPPGDNKYIKIKEELIRRLSASQEEKIRRLLEREEMGDRKPSQFLRHLKDLAGSSMPDEFMRSLWLTRLSTPLHAILAAQDGVDLDAVASLADRISEVIPRERVPAPTHAQVSEVSSDPPSCSGGCSGMLASLLSRMDDLTRVINLQAPLERMQKLITI